MHTLIHLLEWSIGEGPRCEESQPLELRFSKFEISNLVRHLRYDTRALSVFRRRLYQEGEDVSRLSDDLVLEHISHMFETGRLHVCGRRPEYVIVDSTLVKEEEPPPRRESTPPPSEKTWVEIELVDDEGVPVTGETYRIVLPGGSVLEGRLDAHGRARWDDIDPGTCKLTFPDRDADEWKAA